MNITNVEMERKTFLSAGVIVQGQYVSSVDLGDSKLIYKDDIEKYNYKIVSPEANYGIIFEGTKIKVK